MIKWMIFCLVCLSNGLFADAAVTYEFSGGRFGDNLLTYLHAKWLSYHYQIPLIYRPFSYSSELVLDDKEIRESLEDKSRHHIDLDHQHPIPLAASSSVFVCPYFPEIEWELKRQSYFYFKVDWKNEGFRKIVREMISPKKNLQLVFPPQDVLSVAIHLREGGGYDDEGHKLAHPLKTPPLTFYSDSLIKVLDLFPGQPIYCHIFTDALQPPVLIEKIQHMLPPNAPIVFNYRKENNRHDSNVLEDFFSLLNFDILIRAESNFSIVPSFINDYAVVCFPATYSIQGSLVKIEEIQTGAVNPDASV